MSIMRCSKCEEYIDTDFREFDFEQDVCLDCWVDDWTTVKKPFSLKRLLSAMWHMIIDPAGTAYDGYGTERKDGNEPK